MDKVIFEEIRFVRFPGKQQRQAKTHGLHLIQLDTMLRSSPQVLCIFLMCTAAAIFGLILGQVPQHSQADSPSFFGFWLAVPVFNKEYTLPALFLVEFKSFPEY
jgi:hypothetical protein